MEFTGFTETDFSVFDVPGFDERMDALKIHLRPKLEQLGRDLTPILTDMFEVPIYAYVAKHARRRVNPPINSWVALSFDKRGYKKHPHFEIGAWGTHAFAIFGFLAESPARSEFSGKLKIHAQEVLQKISPNYIWIPDHTRPSGILSSDMSASRLKDLATRMNVNKQGELLCGLQVPRSEAVHLNGQAFETMVLRCFENMRPLFRMATSKVGVR